ncbi:MAG: cell division protein FtsA [Dehalococcoidia bacterium]
MGTRDTLYAAVDVGTTKVATLAGRVSPDGGMEIVAMGHAATEGMRKGMVVSPEDLRASIKRSVDGARRSFGRSLPPVYVGITGSHLTCINAAAEVNRDAVNQTRTFSQQDVDRLLLSTFPNVNGRRKVVHVVPRTYQVDNAEGVLDPIGMRGKRLWAESHLVLGDPSIMENLSRVVRSAGVRIKGMVIEHLASAEAVLTHDERHAGAVLVDIGGGTSDIAIYRDGAVWYTAALPVAGYHFTNDIAVGLGVPPSTAEAIKLEHGSAVVDGIDHKESIDVDTGMGFHTRPVSRVALNSLIHDRAVELVRMVLAKVRDSGLVRVPPGGIVLTGGCANLPGLAEIAADYGSCKVRVGSPTSGLGLPAELEHPTFSTAVGLLLWASHYRHAGAIAPDVTVSAPVMERVRGWLSKLALRRPTEVRV